jgi:hypothetical protein
MKFFVLSADALERAGFKVTPADGVPGLWNVEGLAHDVTTNQLHDLATKHGDPRAVAVGPRVMIVQGS